MIIAIKNYLAYAESKTKFFAHAHVPIIVACKFYMVHKNIFVKFCEIKKKINFFIK